MSRGEQDPKPTDPMLGRMIGNHVVEKKLGQGGMGAVYRLKHVRLPDTYAALKVMTAEDSVDMKARFEQEALVAAAIGSHRVAKPMDMGTFEDGSAYIVMEFVAGKSLGEQIRESGALDLTSALKIACRVADTLVLAHEKDIVHRDVKPPNIMLVAGGERDMAIKLLDFGVARASGDLKLAHTAHSVVVGTPGYMSPEAISGGDMDGRTDVFSLGVVLYQMLTGRIPFGGKSVQEVVTRVLTDPTPTIASKRPPELPAVPAAVDAIVSRALAKEAADRYTMLELLHALSALLEDDDAGLMASIVRSPSPGSLPPRQREADPARQKTPKPSEAAQLATGAPARSPSARNLVAIAAVALLAVAGGAWWWLHARGVPPPSPPVTVSAPVPSPPPPMPLPTPVQVAPPPSVPAPAPAKPPAPEEAAPPKLPAAAPADPARARPPAHSTSRKRPARSADEDELK